MFKVNNEDARMTPMVNGCTSLDSETSTLVLNEATNLFLSTERFKESLFRKPCFFI